MVIDGNHRLGAMSKVREIAEGDELPFAKVSCNVYQNLSPTEAIIKGYCINDIGSDSLKTSDYDKVILVKRLWNDQMYKDLNESERMEKLYQCLNSNVVSLTILLNEISNLCFDKCW